MKNRREICDKLGKSGLLCAMLLVNAGCVDKYLPDEKDAFDRNVAYTRTTFDPVMGHIVFYTDICNVANSTLPLTFEITDMMHNDGSPAPELEEFYPVRVWKKPYLGTEKSIDEINAKRGIEYRRLFDVRKNSGEIVMWGEANSGILRCQPDSGYVFNMNISNSGGYKVVKRMRLMPKREVDFEPSIYDSQTGLAIAEYVSPETSRMRYEQNSSSFSYTIEPEDIHVYSIDEVFLDMTGTSLIYPDPVATAHELKDKIHRELGFTVNVGISTNKLLAKMASDFQKPDRVHTLFPDEIPEKMWPLPVRNLLFLGKASEQKLLNQGIRTIGDLAKEREANVQLWLGEKPGHQLWKYARGIDDSTVKAVPDEAKGFSVETTFNDDITSTEQVLPILLEQCDVLATRMRRKGKKCRCISVTFRTLDFRNRSHQTKLENATDLTDEIYENATRLFAEFWRGQPLRLIGVALTGLTDGSYEQMSLFEDTESKERRRKLDVAMDEIRMKFGNDKITRASIMNSNARIGRKARAQMKNEDRQEE